MGTRRSGRAVAAATLAVIGLSMAVQTTAPSAAAALAPVDLVFAESAENSLASKSVDAVCPSGKVVLGGGGRVGWDDSGNVFLTRLVPYGNYYRASAVELAGSGYNKNWKVQAWAICGDPQLNPVVVSAATTAADTPIVDARATTDLLKVIGEGYPHPNFTLTAHAVCTDLPSGYEVVAVGSPELDERMFGEAVTCPQGTKVDSAGRQVQPPRCGPRHRRVPHQ